MRLKRCVWGQIMWGLIALIQSLDYFPNLMGMHWRTFELQGGKATIMEKAREGVDLD